MIYTRGVGRANRYWLLGFWEDLYKMYTPRVVTRR